MNNFSYFIPFFRIITDIRWIYCISPNLPLLNNYRHKLESFTPQRYLEFLRIEILPFESLSEEEIVNHFVDGYFIRENEVWVNQRNNHPSIKVDNDIFYLDGVVNLNRRESVCYNDFTQDKWFNDEWIGEES